MKLLSSVVKTFRVLEAFSLERQELSTIELSKLLEMDKSSVSRIVVTLQHQGYLDRNALNGRYRLSAKFIDLGNQVLNRYDQLDIGEIAMPFLRHLSDTIREVVHLGILDDQEVVTLKKMNGGQIVTVDTKVGGRYPAHSCALGKVLLAGLSEEKRRQILGTGPLLPRTPNTIVELPALREEIARVGAQGYAFEYEESLPGICCVAAPIKDPQGEVLAALSATIPKQRSDREHMREILRHVVETGIRIAQQIYGDV
ncbi:MAG: IclR family transcriptional regulator [Spirochaetales bacterium]|nr:IclR family transcriptional regulator [Spirochaetales bacterium]